MSTNKNILLDRPDIKSGKIKSSIKKVNALGSLGIAHPSYKRPGIRSAIPREMGNGGKVSNMVNPSNGGDDAIAVQHMFADNIAILGKIKIIPLRLLFSSI